MPDGERGLNQKGRGVPRSVLWLSWWGSASLVGARRRIRSHHRKLKKKQKKKKEKTKKTPKPKRPKTQLLLLPQRRLSIPSPRVAKLSKSTLGSCRNKRRGSGLAEERTGREKESPQERGKNGGEGLRRGLSGKLLGGGKEGRRGVRESGRRGRKRPPIRGRDEQQR